MREYPKITFTITTCNRLELFIRTMDSFLLCCTDKELIARWILCDDHSKPEDLALIKQKYPFFEIYSSLKKKGQAANLNLLFSLVKTSWFFHCEDDWLFKKSGNFIKEMFNVVFHDELIKNVTLRLWGGNETITQEGTRYNVHQYDPHETCLTKVILSDCKWYGYTLNPGLQHLLTVRLLGAYDEKFNVNSRFWDRLHAIKYLDLGFKRANLIDYPIEHIGEGQSAYSGW